MDYRCRLIQQIVALDGVAVGERDIILPFPPTFDIGLIGAFTIFDGNLKGDKPDISYDISSDTFILRLDNDKAIDYSIREVTGNFHSEFRWTYYPAEDYTEPTP